MKFNTQTRRRPNGCQNRQGATAVEFAFVFPVIMFFFIGIVAVTQAFLIRDMAQLAAYECAREGTLFDATTEDVEAKAAATIRTMGLRDYTVEILPSTITNSTQKVGVTITVPMHRNAWVAAPFLPSVWNVKSSVELQKIHGS